MTQKIIHFARDHPMIIHVQFQLIKFIVSEKKKFSFSHRVIGCKWTSNQQKQKQKHIVRNHPKKIHVQFGLNQIYRKFIFHYPKRFYIKIMPCGDSHLRFWINTKTHNLQDTISSKICFQGVYLFQKGIIFKYFLHRALC